MDVISLEKTLENVKTMEKSLPVHIGIIMDGNGRWAQKRALPRTAGHKEGLKAAKRIIATASKLNIPFVTLYTFSTENWKRAEEEVGYLMSLIKIHLRSEFAFYKKNGIRIRHTGDINGLPSEIRSELENAMIDTSSFQGTTCVLAINYGSRNEIVRGIQKIAKKATNGEIEIEKIDEKLISSSLDNPDFPDVDLMIRTGGEKRLSNFLLWQSAYAELVFSDTLWPDYTEEEFIKSIDEFSKRNRRFGGVTETERKI